MTETKKKGRPRKLNIKVPESDQFEVVDIIEPPTKEEEKPEEEEQSLISVEIKKFELQIAEIQDAIASIKLKDIEEPEALLKAINGKIAAQLKLPQLLTALEDLKNKQKVRIDAIKGNKSFSPLESGDLDDEED